MKLSRPFLLFILFAVLSLQSYAQTFKNASEYLEFISNEQEDITKNMWRYTKAVAHSKSDRSINNKRKKIVKSIEDAISKIKKADGFDGNDYKEKILKNLNFNLNLMNLDYSKIIDMKAVAEQSYDAMEAYMIAQELADKKMEEAQQEYETNFYDFANKHNIRIIESESDLGKKMALSNEVFSHYKKMYLIYFKVYINEVYLMEALNNGDVGAIEQSSNALSDSAKEGLEILKSVELYKNDKSIINATKTAFEFFLDEAENKMPIITDFLVMNEDFESIKNTLEKTPERKRTKEQIDAYNDKVKLINKGVKDYNSTNTTLNQKRQNVINKLNLTNEKFLSKHIPKD